MHAAYAFLLTLDPEAREAKAEALAAFDQYASEKCDENNWSQPMALVQKDGTVIAMADDDDMRGRGSFAAGYLEKPVEQRWPDAWRFAMSCVLNDMGIAGPKISLGEEEPHPTDGMSFDELLAYVKATAPAEIARRITETPWPKEPTYDHAFYSLTTMAKVFFELAQSKHAPFGGNHLTPYDYRAIDLSEYDEEPNAILFVDCHT